MRRIMEKTCRLISTAVALALTLASLASGQHPTWSGRPNSGWLYVIDSKRNSPESAVLVVDSGKERVVAALSSGFQPDIAVSPDGSRLYLSYSDGRNPAEGKLQVIDTSTGAVLKELSNRNRWLTTYWAYSPNMVLSRDGAWLYLLKMDQSGGAADYIEVFDTHLNAFLSNRITLPECVSAIMVPSEVGVYAVCGGTQDVHFVTVDREARTVRPTSMTIDIANSLSEHISKPVPPHHYPHYPATGFVNPNAMTFTVVTTDGLFLRGDARSGETIDHGAIDRVPHEPSFEPGLPITTGWLQDRWLRSQTPVVSPDGKRIYLGLGTAKMLQHGNQSLDRVVVLDLADFEFISTLNPHRSFWSFAINSSGNRLYVVDSDQAVIGVLDTNNARELGVINGVGTTPVYAVVAP